MAEHTPRPWFFQGYWPDDEWAIGPVIGFDEDGDPEIDPVLSKAQGQAVDFHGTEGDALRIAAVVDMEAACRQLVDALLETCARTGGYDWNADPDAITLKQGKAFEAAGAAFVKAGLGAL